MDEELSVINWAVSLLPRQSNGHPIITNQHRVDELLLFESEREITNPEHIMFRSFISFVNQVNIKI